MTFKDKVIAITRPVERSHEAVEIIENWGGKALIAPTLELQILNSQSLIKLCEMVYKLDWLIFTSPTAILSLFKHCKDLKKRMNPNCKTAVIGPRTGNYLSEYGLEADIIPTDYTAEGLLEAFEEVDIKNQYIGIPRTLAARDVLPQGLKDRGAQVFMAEAYHSDLPQDKKKVKKLIQKIINREVDAVTFTSTLTVKNLLQMLNKKDRDKFMEPLRNREVLVAAIGPVTGKALEEENIPFITPEEYTVKAMLKKLRNEL